LNFEVRNSPEKAQKTQGKKMEAKYEANELESKIMQWQIMVRKVSSMAGIFVAPEISAREKAQIEDEDENEDD
jgi:hypothetical protein